MSDLVVQEDRTQDVKKVVDRLKQLGRTESAIHRKVFWP
jgi:mannose-1-phosphate guanylyltransferase/mannose-6-phosphate isomerase